MSRARRPEPDDPLFQVPPAEFVAARKRLVAELRGRGAGAEARAAAERRKPSVALWAANRVARADRDAVDRLVQAVDRLKTAHVARPADLREAIERQRAAIDALTEAARRALGSIGQRTTPELLARVSATLLGAAVDPDGRSGLRAGRLTEERVAPGFDAFDVSAPGNIVDLDDARRARQARDETAAARPTARRASEARTQREAHAAENARAAEEARKAEAALEARQRRALELEEAAARRAEEAQAAAARAQTLGRELAELTRQEAEARRAVVEARRQADAATREAHRARSGLARRRHSSGARPGSRAR